MTVIFPYAYMHLLCTQSVIKVCKNDSATFKHSPAPLALPWEGKKVVYNF